MGIKMAVDTPINLAANLAVAMTINPERPHAQQAKQRHQPSSWLRLRWSALAIAITLTGGAWPARALDEAGVSNKLATIPVLIPTDAAGNPQLINRPLNGKSTPVLFAAMSPEAAEALMTQVFAADRTSKTSKPQFRATNLVALEEIVINLRKQDPSVVRAYVPDPTQESAVVPLLIEQGAKADAALQTARTQPVVFCPDPLVQVNVKNQQASQTTVPCGMDFREMALFVLSPRLKDRRPSLVALPLERLIALLQQLKGSDGNNLAIVPSPSMQGLLQRLNAASPQKPAAAGPAKTSAPAKTAAPDKTAVPEKTNSQP